MIKRFAFEDTAEEISTTRTAAKRRPTFHTRAHRTRPARLAEVTVARYLDADEAWIAQAAPAEAALLDPSFDDLDCDPADLLGFRFGRGEY